MICLLSEKTDILD